MLPLPIDSIYQWTDDGAFAVIVERYAGGPGSYVMRLSRAELLAAVGYKYTSDKAKCEIIAKLLTE